MENKCKYCSSDFENDNLIHLYGRYVEDNVYLYISDEYLYIESHDWDNEFVENVKINFCPICGKSLDKRHIM